MAIYPCIIFYDFFDPHLHCHSSQPNIKLTSKLDSLTSKIHSDFIRTFSINIGIKCFGSPKFIMKNWWDLKNGARETEKIHSKLKYGSQKQIQVQFTTLQIPVQEPEKSLEISVFTRQICVRVQQCMGFLSLESIYRPYYAKRKIAKELFSRNF